MPAGTSLGGPQPPKTCPRRTQPTDGSASAGGAEERCVLPLPRPGTPELPPGAAAAGGAPARPMRPRASPPRTMWRSRCRPRDGVGCRDRSAVAAPRAPAAVVPDAAGATVQPAQRPATSGLDHPPSTAPRRQSTHALSRRAVPVEGHGGWPAVGPHAKHQKREWDCEKRMKETPRGDMERLNDWNRQWCNGGGTAVIIIRTGTAILPRRPTPWGLSLCVRLSLCVSLSLSLSRSLSLCLFISLSLSLSFTLPPSPFPSPPLPPLTQRSRKTGVVGWRGGRFLELTSPIRGGDCGRDERSSDLGTLPMHPEPVTEMPVIAQRGLARAQAALELS